MDDDSSFNLNSDQSSSDSESAATSAKATKLKKKKKPRKRSSVVNDSSSSGEEIISRPARGGETSKRGANRRPLSSSESENGSSLGKQRSGNIISDGNLPSAVISETPTSSTSSSPIVLTRKNLTSVIHSDTSSASEIIAGVPTRVRHVISESPSSSSMSRSVDSAGGNVQHMSTDDEEPMMDFVRTNRKNNKLSSTESSDDEDCPSCAICLSSLVNRIAAQISGCSHEFHNTCILKWSERTNTCPIDRSKFNKITVKNKEGKVVKITEIEDKNAATADDEEVAFPDEAINCVICGNSDNEDILLLCDGCNRGYHIYCLQPPLASVPEGNWICDHCSPVITLSDSVYFNDELDISIEDYHSNLSEMEASSNEVSDDPDQPSTSTRATRLRSGRYRNVSTLTVSVSSRNRNVSRDTRVRQTTITIKQTRKRKKRRATRRRHNLSQRSTVGSRSRLMAAAALAKRNSVNNCQDRSNGGDTRQRERLLRSEPGRPRLSLFSADNFENYYNPDSDGDVDGGNSGGVAMTARARYPVPRVMDRKSAVARLLNMNRRPRIAPRVTVPSTAASASGINVLDNILGIMDGENRKSNEKLPIKKDGTFVIPDKIDVNSDKNKEKVTETPGYPGGNMPNRPRGHYGAPSSGYQGPGGRHQSGVFSARPPPQFPPRFSNNFTGGGRNNIEHFPFFRSPQPRFRSNAPRSRFPARRSLPASLLIEPEADQEDPVHGEEDVDIYGDIDSSSLVTSTSSVGALAPPPQPPAGLFDLGPPPEPPAALLTLGSPEEGHSDEEKGLIIDDNEYDPADPCDSPDEIVEDVPSPSTDSSSTGLGAIPMPPVHSCAPRPGNFQQSDSDEDCPNSSLYSSTSLAFARKKAKTLNQEDPVEDQKLTTTPEKQNNNSFTSTNIKTTPIRFSITSKHTPLPEVTKKIDLFSEEEDSNNSNDEEDDTPTKEVDEADADNLLEEEKTDEEEGADKETEKEKEKILEDEIVGVDEKTEDEVSTQGDILDLNTENLQDVAAQEVSLQKVEDDDDGQVVDKEQEAEKLIDEADGADLLEEEGEEKEDKEEGADKLLEEGEDDEEGENSANKFTEEEVEKLLKDENYVELDKDEVSTQGDILDLNTENLQDVAVHEGSLQEVEDKEDEERNKSDQIYGLEGLDVDPVSESEYGSLSDNLDLDEDVVTKGEKKKKKKRKNTEREEGEIVEPKKKDRKKDKDENNENGGVAEKKMKKKKDKDFIEMSPLQEKTLSNNKDNLDNEPGESVAWKKLSKNTKDRNYRDKDENKSRKRKETRKEIERYNVRKVVGEKAFIRKDEFGRDISVSRSRSPTFGTSPQRKSPRKRSLSGGRSRSPRKNKKRRSRSKSFDRFRNAKRSLSRSPVRARRRSRSPSPQKPKDRKLQKGRGGRSRSRRRSRTPKKLRSRSRSKPRRRSRSRDKMRNKTKKDKPVQAAVYKNKEGKKKKKKQMRNGSPRARRSRSPRGRSPWDFSSTSISRSPTPPAPRSWSQDKHLTVIVPNTTNKKKDKKKSKENKRRKHKEDHSPTLSKEVFTSGDNILVSVNFAHAEKNVPDNITTVEKMKAPARKSKKDIQAMKAARIKEIAANAKPLAIIDLDVSPFRERTPSPKEVIVLCDSDSENDKTSDLKAMGGPKTPPEPHIKFSINSKNQTINTIANPLLDIDDKQGGPNTPPDPSSPLQTSPYDPFDPTKSRSPSPVSQSATNENLELKTQGDSHEKLDSLKPATPSKDSTQSPSKVINLVNTMDDNSGSTQNGMSKQDDKLVTSSMSTALQSSLPVYTPAMTNSNSRNNMNGGDSMEDIMNLDSDGVYSPASSLGDDLFDPPKKSPPPSQAKSKFDSLFVPKNSAPKAIPYEPKHTKTQQSASSMSGTPKKPAALKYTPTKTKAKTSTNISKLDEDHLKILDDVPSSAVEMQVKYKYLKKLNRQERVVEEVKHVLKPHYNKKHVTKEQYKDILRKSVPKICHNKTGEINPNKIHQLIEAYVKKYRIANKRGKNTNAGGTSGNTGVTNANNTGGGNTNNIAAKKKSMWT